VVKALTMRWRVASLMLLAAAMPAAATPPTGAGCVAAFLVEGGAVHRALVPGQNAPYCSISDFEGHRAEAFGANGPGGSPVVGIWHFAAPVAGAAQILVDRATRPTSSDEAGPHESRPLDLPRSVSIARTRVAARGLGLNFPAVGERLACVMANDAADMVALVICRQVITGTVEAAAARIVASDLPSVRW
jgi:hypothetical protein